MSDTSFNDVIDAIHRFNDSKATSLPQFSRPALIESPNFIQKSLIEEPITGDIIKNLYNIYMGYILVALQMNDMVTGNRTVRDILGTVSTGGFGTASTESFTDTDTLVARFSGDMEAVGSPQGSRMNKEKDHPPIPSGRQMEVKFAAGENNDPISVMVNVKFNSRLIPDEVVEYVIAANFKESVSRRWLQMRAGEIRFFKDFVLNLDRLAKREKALKHDKDNALQSIFRHQNNSSLRQVFKLIMNLSTLSNKNKSYNLANSVMMFDENSVSRYAKKVGMDFKNIRDRRKFFTTTFTLFIVLVDTRYSRVTIYTNGIDQEASYSYSDIKSNASSDKLELKEIVEYLGRSQMPRF